MGQKVIGKTPKAISWLAEQERDAEWEIKPYKQARSNRQNAYYWRLLTEVADRMRMSKAECHNRMLRDYGQPAYFDGEVPFVMLPDTDEAERDAFRSETFHIRPTANVRSGKDHDYRAYIVLRGSHELNTLEMSILLDGLIQEAKQLGIETATPAELTAMQEYDRKREDRKNAQRDTG